MSVIFIDTFFNLFYRFFTYARNTAFIGVLLIAGMLLPSPAHSIDAITVEPLIYLKNKQWVRATDSMVNEQQALKIQLGKRLFEDPLLSESGEMSCATCHLANKGFSDGNRFSLNNQGNPLPYNTPSIQYIAYNYYFGWTGRFPHLQDHLDALIHNPKLMNRDWTDLSEQLKQDSDYPALFKDSGYSDISKDSISDAIIQYEYSLAKPSRYDAYLLGDLTALTIKEKQGYLLFKEFGCNSCHQGINLGGNLRQEFGLMKSIFVDSNDIKQRDFGYYTTTQQEEDRFYFRVPSLRNVSQTAPYFHDGSAETLYQAIEVMFIHQLGIKPNTKDIKLIEAFLHTLEPNE